MINKYNPLQSKILSLHRTGLPKRIKPVIIRSNNLLFVSSLLAALFFFLDKKGASAGRSFLSRKKYKSPSQGFSLRSGLDCSGIKTSKHDFSFQKSCKRNFNIFTD